MSEFERIFGYSSCRSERREAWIEAMKWTIRNGVVFSNYPASEVNEFVCIDFMASKLYKIIENELVKVQEEEEQEDQKKK